jgi:flagellar hook-basal body complex protein FliE
MAIAPIGPMTSLTGIASAAPSTAADAAQRTSGNAFANALENVEAAQDNADTLAVQAATGDLTDIHNYTIAATEASITTQLTVAVRDRAVEAFNEIMRMQI